jgi:hypothetical protein
MNPHASKTLGDAEPGKPDEDPMAMKARGRRMSRGIYTDDGKIIIAHG